MPWRHPSRCPACLRKQEKPGRCPSCARSLKAQRNAEANLARALVRATGCCAVCGGPGTADDPLTMDHKLPVSAGGRAVPGNVRVVHRSFNSSRGAP